MPKNAAPSGSSSSGNPGTLRIAAVVLWVLAIIGEAIVIFRVLRASSINMTLLIVGIVVIGVLAVVGDLLWKRANLMDPASTSEPVRFFIQNQLGAIIGMIAFLPMIVMIFLNKNMSGQQKGLAGGIGIVVLLIASFMGISLNPPSAEQYAQTPAPLSQTASPLSNQTGVPQSTRAAQQQFPSESAVVIGYTGKDLVFWKIDSTVYHLCQGVSELQRVNATNNTIFSGTVADAHAAGKDRLTLQVSEELKQCGYSNTAAPTP